MGALPGALLLLSVFLFGCAGAPLRTVHKEDPGVPAGRVEGDRFTGIRYPFRVSVPPHWKLTTTFPDFMEKLGYGRPSPTDGEQTELYAYNPQTKSNVQFDFTPADPRVKFTRERILDLVNAGAESLKSELDEEFGKGVVSPEYGPTSPSSLKGVPVAAKKYASYNAAGARREQGWIYGFAEPYQVFVIYLILGPAGSGDREDVERIISSFEYLPRK